MRLSDANTAIAWLALILVMLPFGVRAEKVSVKYGVDVDLAPLDCEWVTKSSLIGRLCYDRSEQYVIVQLRDTYYQYCKVPAAVVDGWRQAESMGRYYNACVKGRYDCRVNRLPPYAR